MNILLIDDDPGLRKSLRLALGTMGHTITEASDSGHAQDRLGHGLFDVAFLDLRLGREQGLDVLPALLRLAPGLNVVVITAYATIETAVEAMRRGAFDYLPKPFTPDQLRVLLDKVTRQRRLQSHVERTGRAGPLDRARGRSAHRGARDQGRPRNWRSRRRPARRPSCFAARAAPAKACWRGPSTPAARAAGGRSSRSTARACRRSCWRASCSATSAGPSPAPSRDTDGKVAGGRGRDAVPRRDRRPAAGAAAEAAAAAAGEGATSVSARHATRAADVRILAATNRDLERRRRRRTVP